MSSTPESRAAAIVTRNKKATLLRIAARATEACCPKVAAELLAAAISEPRDSQVTDVHILPAGYA